MTTREINNRLRNGDAVYARLHTFEAFTCRPIIARCRIRSIKGVKGERKAQTFYGDNWLSVYSMED